MFFFKKRKKVQTQQQPSEPAPESLCVTTVLTPEKTSILEIANLQGLGQREQQQDAFGISPADRYETDGILAVLCDGMGGMAEGQRIACQTIACLLNAFPFPEPAVTSVPKLISACTQTIYQQFTATAAAPLSLPGFWEINCTSGASETATFFCSGSISSMH